MRKSTKVWLITAAALVFGGGIIFAGVMSTLGWDFAKLSTVRYETNTYEIGETFSNISLTSDNADIIFALSDDGKCRVECYEEENAKHSAGVENDTLTVKVNSQKLWYDYIGLSLNSPRITVYLPKTEYNALFISESTGNIEIPQDYSFNHVDISVSTGDIKFFAAAQETVKIKTSTGNICVEDNSAGTLDLSATTGDVSISGVTCNGSVTVGVSIGEAYLTDIVCGSVISSGSTGDITLSNVIAKEKISVERSTGDVKFNGCDAAEIYVRTNTGDVTGSLLSNKAFIADTNLGDVDVPKNGNGGKCEIITDVGDIRITVEP